MDEDRDSTSEPIASTLPTAEDSTEASLSEKSGIKKCKLSSWLKEPTELPSLSSTPQTLEQQMKKEIENYIKLPLLDAESDPLQWWKVHMAVLPTMAKLP